MDLEELKELEREHIHCLNCMRTYCKEKAGCPVEYCKNSCGSSMHRCKWPDHDREICPEAMVNCTNVRCGCEEMVKRKDLTAHIAHCPASTVYCRFAYTRHVAAKLGECAREEPSSLIDKQMLDGDVNLLQDSPKQQSLSLSIENEGYGALQRRNSGVFAAPTNARFSISKESDEYFFCCNQFIRRDKFQTHWRTYHLEVQLGLLVKRCPLSLYGCGYGQDVLLPSPPGTTLSFDRETDSFLASGPHSNADLPIDGSSQATVTQYEAKIKEKKELSEFGYGDDEDESYDVLGQLPIEVLLYIFRQVDSMTLWNLSLVNHYFRKVCFCILGKKMGIVYNKWTKGPNLETPTWTCCKVIESVKCGKGEGAIEAWIFVAISILLSQTVVMEQRDLL